MGCLRHTKLQTADKNLTSVQPLKQLGAPLDLQPTPNQCWHAFLRSKNQETETENQSEGVLKIMRNLGRGHMHLGAEEVE